MTEQTDLENLKQLQEAGKIDKNLNISKIADRLPEWRESSDAKDKQKLAKYGNGKDLDILVRDKNTDVRKEVARRGRDKDLDILTHDPDEVVRWIATNVTKDKDLENLEKMQKAGEIGQDVNLEEIIDKLPKWRKSNKQKDRLQLAIYGRDHDLDKLVRNIADDHTRKKDLENLKKLQKAGKIDKDDDLNKIANKLPKWRESNKEIDKVKLTRYGRDQDLDRLVHDKFRSVRQSVADRGRDQDLDLLVNDEDWAVRWEVANQGRKQDIDKLVSDSDDEVWRAAMQHLSDYILVNDKD